MRQPKLCMNTEKRCRSKKFRWELEMDGRWRGVCEKCGFTWMVIKEGADVKAGTV